MQAAKQTSLHLVKNQEFESLFEHISHLKNKFKMKYLFLILSIGCFLFYTSPSNDKFQGLAFILTWIFLYLSYRAFKNK